jgi:uncharacterized protein
MYFIILWFSAFLLVTTGAQAGVQTDAEQQIGLLWQIEAEGYTPSYLFATIHSEDPRVMQLPPPVEQAYIQADSVTIEVEITISALLKSLVAMYLPPGQTLDKLIAADKYQRLIELLEPRGIPEIAAKTMKPAALVMFLSVPKSETGEFLDMMLYLQAQERGQAVHGLETIEEQLRILDILDLDEQVILLEQSLDGMADFPDLLEKMHQLYLQRNLTSIMQFSLEYMQNDEHQKIVDKFMNYIVDQRNFIMLERMRPRLQEGNAFIAVGAMHLPGERGLIKLLEQNGFTLTSIY